jgi:hypothetical protein
MSMVSRRVRAGASLVATTALLAGLILVSPASALASSAGGSYTCSGGPLPGGPYNSVVITGQCAVNAGDVTVKGNLTIAAGGELLAAFDGNNVAVAGNVSVGTNGVLVLGCDPEAFPCLDNSGGSVSATIGGNLSAYGALAEVVHDTDVAGNLTIDGGGGGVNCDPQSALFGFPAYATFEQVAVGKNATITGWHSCWLGMFRTHVTGNMTFDNNVTADPDGNEIQTNWIGGNLSCSGNSPQPQQGDSQGQPNVVGGKALGQCSGLTQ